MLFEPNAFLVEQSEGSRVFTTFSVLVQILYRRQKYLKWCGNHLKISGR